MIILAKFVIISMILLCLYFPVQDYFEWPEVIFKVWFYINICIVAIIVIYLTLVEWEV